MRRLTKKMEGEILKLYHAYWNAYLAGDFKAFASYLDENTTVFGTAQGEVFTSRQETVKFYKATADQMTGKADFRKRKISASAVGDTIMVNEQSDLYVLVDSAWVFYGHSRITAIFEQKGNSWKLVHQHASFPDSRTEEGEQIATKKIQKENLELREAVKRRTIELEEKNRELEIETALEKVRAIAMGMKERADMLKICKTISQQLAGLGLREIRNVQTAIFNVPAGTYMNYEYYAKHRKTFITETLYTNHKVARAFAAKMLKGKGEVSVTYIKGKEKVKDWLKYQKSTNVFIDSYLYRATSLTYYWFSLGPVALGISTYLPLSKEEVQLFQRFLKVFELAYRRYLDIEKAFAQAKEAQIEASLERVRAAAMAMRNSGEIRTLINQVYGELTRLDAKLDRCFFMIVNPVSQGITWWMAGPEGLLSENGFFVQYNQHPSHLMYLDHWKKRRKKWLYLFEGKEKRDWDRFGFTKTELARLPDPVKKFMAAAKKVYLSGSSDAFGSLVTGSFEPLSDEHQNIISRFATVFNQSYTRFLDLQKAEAQAREAQIEAALERIRSKVTAMQESSELLDIVVFMRREFVALSHEAGYFWYMRWLSEKYEKAMTSVDGSRIGMVMELPRHIHGDIPLLANWEKSEEPAVVYAMDVDAAVEYVDKMIRLGDFKQVDPNAPTPDDIRHIGGLTFVMARTTHGEIGYSLTGVVPNPPEEDVNTLVRFAAVFDLAYRRFEDLKEAERRNRETQIELALERVRSRTMAMHKSEELKEVIRVVLEQFITLNINVGHAGFYIDYKDHDDMHIWLADPNIEPFFAIIPYFDTPTWNSFLEAKAKGTTLHTDLLDFEEKNKFYQSLFKLFTIPEEAKEFYLQCRGLAVSTVLLDNVGLYIENFDAVPYSDEENNILMRFGKVFQQTYTRFLDLQKAEAQAREAQIEAALERVRSKAMAMHSTSELKEVVHELRKQMGLLGQKKLETCVIHLHDESEDFIQSWAGINPPDMQGEILETIANVPKKGLVIIEEALKAYSANLQEYIIINEGEKLKQWFSFLEKASPEAFTKLSGSVKGNIEELKAFWSFADFAGGSLIMVTLEEPDEPTRGLLRRFSNVFGLAYRRFADLKQAEAQTREAQIEAALEKVRSRSLAMQRPRELTEVAELLRKEMGQLGVEELETSSIYIVDKENEQAECWYAIKDIREESKNLVSDEMTITFADTRVGSEMGRFYRGKKEQVSIVMKGDNRKEWINYCAGKSKVLQGYYGDEIPERTYHLVKFNGGYMGAASPGDISAESWDLLRRAASVFSLAYTRFNDLKIAEAHALQAERDLIAIKEAKQKAEEALSELQTTQKQLIQSEKMASLGELTAGIAHEIQNPLNFVNNFSEVSKELLGEMKEELEKGNMEEAREIMNDVIQNLEKINHHGKRADGIVKGMLQHSRSSSGQKEMTDINALCDEYLRLAYHGLRAKDKSFNAKFESHFDETVGNIDVMPQDMGRVVLNLINNAFYAVSERKKAGETGYEPTVIVSTKKENGNVIISVKDNGTGISQKVLDKIFQPFFTTKPTGQGTGLGLSLSYDIVKAHGGELKVETKEGEGTQFFIQLP